MEPNRPSLLIGSRGWVEAASEYGCRVPQDTDLTMPFREFARLVNSLSHTMASLVQMEIIPGQRSAIKYVLRLLNGERIEVEIAERFASYDMVAYCAGSILPSLTVGQLNAVTIENCHLFVPAPHVLFTFKLSHFFLSINWRKTAKDIVDMLDWFGASVREIMTTTEHGGTPLPDLKQLMKFRLCENVAVNYTLRGTQPVCISEADHRVAISRSDLEKLLDEIKYGETSAVLPVIESSSSTKGLVISTPLLPGINVSTASFQALPLNSRRKIISEIIIAVAWRYYLHPGTMSIWLNNPSIGAEQIADEAYLLALESICTKTFAAPTLPTSASQSEASLKSWAARISVYDKFSTTEDKFLSDIFGCPKGLGENDAFEAVLPPRDLVHLPVPTLDQVAQFGVPVNDPLANFILNDLKMFIQTPPHLVKLVEAFSATARGDQQRALASRFGTDLPKEIYEHILSYINDHVSFQALSRVNQSLNALCSNPAISGPMWQRLCRTCFTPATLKREGHILKPEEPLSYPEYTFRSIWKMRWSAAQLPVLLCPHCNKLHKCVSEAEWDRVHQYEHTRGFCVCPDCYRTTGSWNSCRILVSHNTDQRVR